MPKNCLIISGGPFCPLPENLPSDAFVIVCDRGIRYAEKLGITPHLILGDFDSHEKPVTTVPVEVFPIEKDDTDTMLAVRRALKEGCDRIDILCAFGGRADHAFANIQTAAFAARRGAVCRLYGDGEESIVFSGGSVCVKKREGWSLACFALSDQCTGVTIRGAKYEGEDITLTADFPLGMSNEFAADQAEIHCGSGILMVMCVDMKGDKHLQDMTEAERKRV